MGLLVIVTGTHWRSATAADGSRGFDAKQTAKAADSPALTWRAESHHADPQT